jgi:hypothetical protein
VIAYVITWLRKPIAQPFVLDVNTPELAAEVSLRLASTPLVYDVKVSETEYDIDPELKARIWKRVEERLRIEDEERLEAEMYAFAFQEASK